MNTEDCGYFCLLRVQRCILETSRNSQTQRREKGANFRVFSTLEQCLGAFDAVASSKGRQWSILPSHKIKDAKMAATVPLLQGKELPTDGLRVAAGLPEPQQRVEDGGDRAAVQAAQLQAPVRDLAELRQGVLGADLVLPVVEVALHGGEAQPVHLLRLWGDLDLVGGSHGQQS